MDNERHKANAQAASEQPHSTGQQQQQDEQLSPNHQVLQLEGAQELLDSTETDAATTKSNNDEAILTIDAAVAETNEPASSTSQAAAEQLKEQLADLRNLIKDTLDEGQPHTAAEAQVHDHAMSILRQPLNEEGIQQMLQFLDFFLGNLQGVEAQADQTVAAKITAAQNYLSYLRRGEQQASNLKELHLTNIFELPVVPITTPPSPALAHLSTQTSNSLVLNTQLCGGSKSLASRKALSVAANSSVDSRPPCERVHHTITISANNSMPRVELEQPQTLRMRIRQAFRDLAAALCICLQINKDCIFCLGFFIVFVVSASFLTAFFYRTLSLSTQGYARVPQEAVLATNSYQDASVRFNGGYYYIYNNQRQQHV